MTSPSLGSSYGGYGGGYYATPSFPDTPIYDSLVAERGTPQIAPIRVPAAYDGGSNLPALPSALPALTAGPSYAAPRGYQAPAPQPAPLQQAPSPYFQQQAGPDRGGYQSAPQQYQQQQQPMRPVAPRPAAPRPAVPRQMPGVYEDPYGRQHPAPGY
ncbi:hypothetical protein QNO07_15190 [Streptomyces sp. 549]|uniref:DUF6643 family protein n=1 Tax=Streptomyces sp. 549 TaxID=3049076 RepID=UPI0024C28DDB|nr:DUF6643 family protein [Streptomyces sp. 549]MDK1474750.1 hypothetical protein [Streptomyces sp. 549]